MNVVQEWVIDAHGCQGDLHSVETLEKVARRAVEAVGATVAASTHYAFQPHGLTLVLILKESHFILSTWPEHQMCIVNVFLCNPQMDPGKVWHVMEAHLKPQRSLVQKVAHDISSFGAKKRAA